MSMSALLKDYMNELEIAYQLEPHSHSLGSSRTARLAHVPGNRLAKAVLLTDELGYVVAVIPSTRRVALGEIHLQLDRSLGLATEAELPELFPDCELGAIPPVGFAYGLDTVIDSDLLSEPEVWFEAGDHEELVRISRNQFRSLMADARPGHFSHHA